MEAFQTLHFGLGLVPIRAPLDSVIGRVRRSSQNSLLVQLIQTRLIKLTCLTFFTAHRLLYVLPNFANLAKYKSNPTRTSHTSHDTQHGQLRLAGYSDHCNYYHYIQSQSRARCSAAAVPRLSSSNPTAAVSRLSASIPADACLSFPQSSSPERYGAPTKSFGSCSDAYSNQTTDCTSRHLGRGPDCQLAGDRPDGNTDMSEHREESPLLCETQAADGN